MDVSISPHIRNIKNRKMSPCKRCGGKQYSSGRTKENEWQIQCRECGNTVFSTYSADDAVEQWNNQMEHIVDPDIPRSPDGKWQIYSINMRQQNGSIKKMYAVPYSTHFVYGHGDSLHETLAEAAEMAEGNRKRYEEHERWQEQQEQLRLKRLEEKSRREDLNGFGDELTPMRRGRIVQYLQKVWRFDSEHMTMRDFIHKAYRQGKMSLRVTEINRERVKPTTVYCVNDTDVGKMAYDYAAYLLKNKIALKEWM